MFPLGIRNRIIFSTLIITILSLSLLGAYLLHFFYTQNLENETLHLINNARIIETTLEPTLSDSSNQANIETEIRKISSMVNLRITILDLSGNVLADSWENASDLDNHLERQEIQAAFHSDYATAIRYSTTIEQNMLYVAIPFYQNNHLLGIVRTATTLTPIEESYTSTKTVILSALVVTIFITILVGAWLAYKNTKPIKEITAIAERIADGHISERIHLHTNDEIEVLAHTLNHLTSKLEEKIIEIDSEAKKLSLILENMDNAVILLDSYGNVTTANKTAKELFAISPSMLGKHSISVIGNSLITSTATDVLSSKQSKSIHLKIKIQDTPKTFQIFFAPIESGDDTTSVLSVFHDVSVMQEIYDRQVDFVTNASHELATPLTSIKGFAETLLDGALESPALSQKFVGIIHTESERMHRLIKDLLQLAKLDTKEYRKQIQLDDIDIKQVFQAAAQKLLPLITDKNQTFSLDVPQDLPTLKANYDWMMQLIINLVENAIKYTPNQGEIVLKCWQQEDHIWVSVKDSGIGIAPADLPFVFDRFYRADRARSRKEGGSGIGLSLVRFIVEIFGGKIKVESKINIGTTFTFNIPLTK